MSNIYEKLAAARKTIRNTTTKKAGRNTYSGYDYFTPEQVEQLVFTACEKEGLIVLTSLRKDGFGYFQELILKDIQEPMSELRFELRTEMPEIKATNAAQQMGGMDTYSERYIKMKVFQIKDNNLDFDAHDNRKVYPSKPISPEQYSGNGKVSKHSPRYDDAEHDVSNA